MTRLKDKPMESKEHIARVTIKQTGSESQKPSTPRVSSVTVNGSTYQGNQSGRSGSIEHVSIEDAQFEISRKYGLSQEALISFGKWLKGEKGDKGDSGDISIGTCDYWASMPLYFPRKGEIVVYTDFYKEIKKGEEITIPNIKIGTGNAYLADLAFIDQYVLDQLKNHIEDMERHITDEERMRWDNKINITQSVQGETLVFDRN